MTPRKWLLLLIVGLTAGAAHAQSLADLQGQRGGAYIRFAEPGDITIQVTLWGSARAGIYEVTQGMHLSTLLSIAGGPPVGAVGQGGRMQQFGQGDIISDVTIRLMREQGAQWTTLLEVQMEKEVTPLPEDPVLQDGDLIIVDTDSRRTFGWRDGLQIIGSVGATVFLIDRLIDLANGDN